MFNRTYLVTKLKEKFASCKIIFWAIKKYNTIPINRIYRSAQVHKPPAGKHNYKQWTMWKIRLQCNESAIFTNLWKIIFGYSQLLLL
jgi:hypothetical protein